MPRKPRMYLAGVPAHVVQRGHNHNACFFAEQDYQYYLECIGDAAQRYGVDVHAYVLMTNHVHMLLTPATDTAISSLMQSLGRRYVQYINKRYRRSGTLWEGRHKASLVDAENYLLQCYRYIELNPVRAGMVQHPGDYRWSSYRCNAWGGYNKLITPHALYIAQASQQTARQHAYRELFHIDLSPKEMHQISRAASFSMPLGNARFIEQIERAVGRSVGYAKRGRPRRRKAR